MKDRYRAIFILPSNAQKVFGEAGWEFFSSDRLSDQNVDALVRALTLEKSDAYLGIEEFVGDRIKMLVFFDDDGQAEHICIRIYEDLDVSEKLLSCTREMPSVEVFVP